MIPQNITNRYISNLIHNGSNKDFMIERIVRELSLAHNQIVGHFFIAVVTHIAATLIETKGVGATPEQAVERALIAHGVTFR